MARYQHLPIYKSSYDLLARVAQYAGRFPKSYKYSLGSSLVDAVTEMVVFIFKANSTKSRKRRYVMQFMERLTVVQLLLRLAKDLRIISIKQFSGTVEITDSLARQAQGWIKQQSASLAELR